MKRLKKIGYIPPILDAYVFYYDKIFDYISLDEAGEISEPDSKRLKILFQSFLDDFRVVEIDLDSGDDAQIIFETMNDRGTPLLASDLIRNYIFSRGEQSKEDVELLYDNEWSYFEDWFWTVKSKQGRYTRPRLEHFVVHFLGAHTGQEVNHGRIFPEYKSYIEKFSKYNNIREEINDLKVFGDIYRNLVEPNTEEVFGRFSERLLVWDVTTIYPLILRIMSDDKVEGFEKIEMFHLLESYIVRRMICRLTPKNYNKLFLQIVRKHRNKTISKKSLLEDLILSTSPSSMWPKDDMFKTSFLTMPMYRVFPPARVKTILLELEHSKRSKLSEEIKILSPLTVEHVMPQNWKANWKSLPSKDRYDVSKWHRAYTNPYPNKANVKYLDEIERREQLIHSIGNLTLLTQALNSTVRDSIYRKKRSHIIKQSSLSLNRYFQKIPEWSESKIQQRANTLFRTAQRIWPFPFEVFDG